VKEHPILFSGPMVRAILEGRKTQTRRICKVPSIQPENADTMRSIAESCPYGQPGDLLWVRETWGMKVGVGILYRADGGVYETGGVVWKPSIHMRRADSRLTLRIADVRVQRVREIGAQDATAEGLPALSLADGGVGNFRKTWDSLNAKRGYSWESNPWVWAVTFERCA
jgi:hypothetical protein